MEKIYLDQNSPAILHLCKKDKKLAKLIEVIGPLSYTTKHTVPYVFFVKKIVEQMLSIKAAEKIYSRLENMCQENVTPERISNLTDEQIKSIGISNSKVSFIRDLTNKILSNKLDLQSLETLSDEDIYKELLAIKGIGKWTVKMYLLSYLGRQDILPFEDVAFIQGYLWLYKTKDKSKTAIEKKCKKWKPYSSIAARYLYTALNMGLTKESHLSTTNGYIF